MPQLPPFSIASVASLWALGFWALAGSVHAQPSAQPGAAALTQKHAALSGQLAKNVFRRPLVVESTEGANTVSGNAFAVLDAPFSTVSTTFKTPAAWCEVLILHINTKYCQAGAEGGPNSIKLYIGRKHAQELKDALALQFVYRLASSTSDYLEAELNSDKGPVGTKDYRIELQAIPLPNNKTFLHLQYSYGYGVASKIAMQGYLATLGSGKVGFTQTAQPAPGQKPAYVGGVRGAVERNTMRYYLAIEAYLASLNQPAAQQLNARLSHWFDATENYAEQLHEVDKNAYLSMKKDEYARQQTAR